MLVVSLQFAGITSILAQAPQASPASQAPQAPAPAAITIQEISGNRLLWPPQVIVNTPVKVAMRINGKLTGTADVPAGRTFLVVQVTPTAILVNFQGSTANVAPSQTDILARAGVIKGQLTSARAAAALLPKPTPLAAPVQPTPAPETGGKIAKAIQNSLVKLEGERAARQQASALNGVKYYGIYFSAHWCGPCRKFTPQLVSFYNEAKAKHPEFEILFVSNDRSEKDMENYMKTEKMPWLALDYGTRDQKRLITDLAGNGIPCLVLVDAEGKVLSDSYENGDYVGPVKVMRDIASLLEKGKIEG